MSAMGQENVGVQLTADVSQYQQSMRAASDQTNALVDALQRASRGMDDLIQKGNRTVNFISAGTLAGVVGLTTAAGNLERQMSTLQSQATLSNQNFGSMSATVVNLRRELGMTTTEVTQLATGLQQMGQRSGNTRQLITTYQQMAAVTGESVTNLTQAQTQLRRTMSMGADAAKPMASATSVLAANLGTSATAITDYANAMAPLARTSGMTTKEVLGLSAAFAKQGKDGEAAFGAFNKVLEDVRRAADTGSPALQQYSALIGMTTDQFKELDRSDAVVRIFDEINRQGPRSVKILERLGIDGVQAAKAIQDISKTGGFQEALGMTNKSWGDTGKFDDASKTALAELNNELKKSSEIWKDLAQSMGSVFLPAAKTTVELFNTALAPVKAFSDALKNMPSLIKAVVTSLAALAIGAPVVGKVLGGLSALGGAKSLVSGPFGAGVRMGAAPEGRMTNEMINMMGGAGSLSQRAAWRAGLKIGDFANVFGSGGDLSAHTFRDARGNVIPMRSTAERWVSAADRAKARQSGMFSRAGGGVLGRLNRSDILNQAIVMGGEQLREPLRMWQPGVMRAGESYAADSSLLPVRSVSEIPSAVLGRGPDLSLSPRERLTAMATGRVPTPPRRERATKPTTLTDKQNQWMAANNISYGVAGGSDPRFLLSEQDVKGTKHEATFKKLTENFEKVAAEGEKVTKAHKNLGSESTKATNNLKTLFAQGGKTVVSGAGAVAGAAGGGLATLGRGLASIIGPQQLALMAGTAAIGFGVDQYNQIKDRRKDAFDVDPDKYIGSEYRAALGLAADATRSFADTISKSTNLIKAKDLQQATTVTSADANAVIGGGYQYTASSIASMNKEQAVAYATNMVQFGTVDENQAMKYDLIKRFGVQGAEEILDNAKDADTTAGVSGLVTGAKSSWWRDATWGTATKEQKEAGAEASATIRRNQSVISDRYGTREGGQYMQAAFNESVDAQFADGDPLEARSKDIRWTGARRELMYQGLSALGVDSEDKESIKAYESALRRTAAEESKHTKEGRYLSEEERAALAGSRIERFYGHLDETAEGTELATRMKEREAASGGRYLERSVDYQRKMQDDPLMALGQSRAGFLQTVGAGFTGQPVEGQPPTEGAKILGGAIDQPENQRLQFLAMTGLRYAAQDGTTGGGYEDTAKNLNAVAAASKDTESQLYALARAAQEAARVERDINARISGQNTSAGRIERAGQDYNIAVDRARQMKGEGNTLEEVEQARLNILDIKAQETERLTSIARQYQDFDYQAAQGRTTMARGQRRQMEDTQYSFGRQREDMLYQQGIQRAHYDISVQRSWEDFIRGRTRAQEQFDITRNRSERDYNKSIRRAWEDYNRGRLRSEQDFNRQLVRMAEQSAKSVYDIYQRVLVQQSWSGGNLLVNLADQQARLVEQNRNLDLARQMGLSNDAIDALGLNQADKAQQLGRLISDMQTDPELVGELNRLIVERTEESTKLMRDESSKQWQYMQEDRQLQLARQEEDFNLSLNRGREDYNTSLDDMNADFQRGMDQQLADFHLAMRRGQEDFQRSMNEATANFNRMRDRLVEDMNRSFSRQREDYEYQMNISRENISWYAREVSMSFDEAFDAVHQRTQGETRRQIEVMRNLLDTLIRETVEKNNRLVQEINKAYAQFTVNQGGTMINPTTGLNASGGRPMTGGGTPTAGGPTSASMMAFAASLGSSSVNESGDAEGRAVVNNYIITAGFGEQGDWPGGKHPGIDLAGSKGDPIAAISEGIVQYIGKVAEYGNLTKVRGDDGFEVWYGHQDSFAARPGQRVKTGDMIGRVGHTGRTIPDGPEGAHVHLEVHQGNQVVDPSSFIKGSKGQGGKGGPGDTYRPVTGSQWSTYSGHTGIDMARPKGTPIYNYTDGTVRAKTIYTTRERYWGVTPGYGRDLVMQHANGLQTRYSHLSAYANQNVGDFVPGGAVIGFVGQTGKSTGPHLHWEYMPGGRSINSAASRYFLAAGTSRAAGSPGPDATGSVEGSLSRMALPRADTLKAVKDWDKWMEDIGWVEKKRQGVTKGLMAETVQKWVDAKAAEFGFFGDPGGEAGPISGTAAQVARALMDAGKTLGANRQAMKIALMTVFQESSMQPDYTRDSNGDLGLFQNRPGRGDGTPAQLNDPLYSLRLFLYGKQMPGGYKLPSLYDQAGWASKPEWQAAAWVQRPLKRYEPYYQKHESKAEALLNSYGYYTGIQNAERGSAKLAEHGPELLISPQRMDLKGGEAVVRSSEILNFVRGAKQVTPQSGPVTQNNTWDHSRRIEIKEVTVVANDAREFSAELERQARFDALVSR